MAATLVMESREELAQYIVHTRGHDLVLSW